MAKALIGKRFSEIIGQMAVEVGSGKGPKNVANALNWRLRKEIAGQSAPAAAELFKEDQAARTAALPPRGAPGTLARVRNLSDLDVVRDQERPDATATGCT